MPLQKLSRLDTLLLSLGLTGCATDNTRAFFANQSSLGALEKHSQLARYVISPTSAKRRLFAIDGHAVQEGEGLVIGGLTKAIASLMAMLFGGLALDWLLGAGAARLPLPAGNIFALLAWIGIPLLTITTALPWPRTRKRSALDKAGGMARLMFGLIGLAALVLLTDVGILVAGHKYWIARAFSAPTDAESRRCLSVIFRSTQYGPDIVEGELELLPAGERRRKLELAFLEMTDSPP